MKRLLAATLLALGAAVLAAAPAAPLTSRGAERLALDDCLKLAAENHPALTAAQAGVAAATEAVGEARAPYYPQVDLSAGYHRFQKRAFLPSGLLLPGRALPELVGPLDDWTGGFTSRYTLYDFGERRAGLEAARARQAGAEADAATTRADVRLGVQSAFYALAAAQDLQAAAEKNLARTESHLRLAQARREAGAVPQADVLRMQAEVASAQLQLLTAQSRVRTALGQLNTTIGRPPATPLAIAPPTAVPPPGAVDLEAAMERAVANRSELKSSDKRTAAARAEVTAARAARAPKLHADGSFGWNDTAWTPETREWQAGLSIDLPIFDAGSRVRRIARTRAELVRQEAAMESSRLQVRQEVWAAAAELDRAWAAIAANETAVRANEESLRVVRERYQNGAALITDLLDNQTALANAEASLAGARWTYLTARATFDRAVGTAP